ncbi:MAG: DNA internalization-related competence protein ComEC/Rec2 [bacterium]
MFARRPALAFALPFAAGIWVGGTFGMPAGGVAVIGAAGLPITPLLLPYRATGIAVAAMLGLLRGADDAPRPFDDTSTFHADSLWSGRVVARRTYSFTCDDVRRERVWPASRDAAAGDDVLRDARALHGRVEVGGADSIPPLGARVHVRGRLETIAPARNPGLWDARRLARRDRLVARIDATALEVGREPEGAAWRVERVLREWRDGIIARHEAIYDSSAAAFAHALFLGDRSHLDPDLGFDFRDAGGAHLLALSGEHVSLVALFVERGLAFLRVGRIIRLPASLALIGTYVLITGAPASVARAGLVFAIVLGAVPLRRRLDAANALGVSLTLLLLFRPEDLWDAGLLLSYGATAGIIFLYPRLRERIAPDAKGSARVVADLVLVTLSATLPLAPLEAALFGAIPVTGLITNPILVPLTGLLLALHVTTLTASLVPWALLRLPEFHRDLAALTTLVTRLDVHLVHLLASHLPPPALVPDAWLPCAALYTFVCAVLFAPRRSAALGRLAAAPFLAMIACAMPARAPLAVTVLDVGQGDAIAISTHRSNLLVDAGPRWSRSDMGARVVVPALRHGGARALDAAIFSHGDADHCGGGVTVARRLDVRRVFEPDPSAPPRSRIHAEMREAAAAAGIDVDSLRTGDRLLLGGGVTARTLHPHAESPVSEPDANGNDRSVALDVSLGRVHVLLTGDLAAAEEMTLDVPRGAILKVAHHGSRGSSPERMLSALRPPVAIISAGVRNRYRHPHEETLARLSRAGAMVYRTDRDGAVTIETDGVRVLVRPHLDGVEPAHLVYSWDGVPRAAGALARASSASAVSRAH